MSNLISLTAAYCLYIAAAAAASDTADLPREQKLALLKQLRKALKQMHAQLQRAEAGPSSQVQSCLASRQSCQCLALCKATRARWAHAVQQHDSQLSSSLHAKLTVSSYREPLLVRVWKPHRHQQWLCQKGMMLCCRLVFNYLPGYACSDYCTAAQL